jgi:hypothetical protein
MKDKNTEEIKQIINLHNEMHDLTLDAGIGPKRYESLATNLEKKKPETILAIHLFLLNVYMDEYRELKRVWTLPTMTPMVWRNYEDIFHDTDFPEMTILKSARKALKERYVAFFKNKKRQPGIKVAEGNN